MPVIRIKRGNKALLPTLNTGEAAFTIDTKELFIGDGTNNYGILPTNQNLLVNSNFQFPLVASDTDNASAFPLLPGKGRYIYGNFFLSNGPSASGNITATGGIKNLNNRLSIGSSNGLPKLEYRLKLPRYLDNNKAYVYLSSLENHTLTLSYDIQNSLEKVLRIRCGNPSTSVLLNVPVGLTRLSTSFTFNKTTLFSNIPCMDIVIAQFVDYINGGIEIGNVKLEEGNKQTPYFVNSLDEDLAKIDMTYKIIDVTLKPYIITANTIEFHLFNEQPFAFDYNGVFNILSSTLLSQTLVAQTQFSYAISFDTNYNTLKIVATKNTHGLTGATLFLKLELDYRPY